MFDVVWVGSITAGIGVVGSCAGAQTAARGGAPRFFSARDQKTCRLADENPIEHTRQGGQHENKANSGTDRK